MGDCHTHGLPSVHEAHGPRGECIFRGLEWDTRPPLITARLLPSQAGAGRGGGGETHPNPVGLARVDQPRFDAVLQPRSTTPS